MKLKSWILPVCPWPLVQGSCSSWAVLAAKSCWTGHIIIRDCRWFNWLQGLIRSVPSGKMKQDKGGKEDDLAQLSHCYNVTNTSEQFNICHLIVVFWHSMPALKEVWQYSIIVLKYSLSRGRSVAIKSSRFLYYSTSCTSAENRQTGLESIPVLISKYIPNGINNP